MTPVRLRGFLVCAALVLSQLPASPAHAQSAHCEDDTTAEVMLEAVSAGAGPASCTAEISCPKTHRGACRVEGKADIGGLGLLAAEVVIGRAEPGTCSGPGGCSATSEARLGPGKTTRIECSMTSATVAASVTLTCSGSAS